MSARFDHLVIAVEDLDEAASRWGAAGLPASRGGAHPVGTENVLVRGPSPAYVELIAAGSGESNPWLDRVRSAPGPISWAIAVDDLDAARTALVAAGFDPDPPVPGSRRTPDGDLLEWRVCDVGSGPYDGALPFLIEWTAPMGPGPADGPVVEHVSLTPPDPEPLADLLLALGFVPSEHWPRRMFHSAQGPAISLLPVGTPTVGEPGASWFMSWEDGGDEPAVSLTLAVPGGELTGHPLDGVAVSTRPDRRRFAAAALLPAVDEAFARLRGDLADWPDPHPGGRRPAEDEYSRVTDPSRYRLLGVRADAWVDVLTSTGLGVAETVDPAAATWLGEHVLTPSRVTLVRGREGTQPVVVARCPSSEAAEAFVQVGVGEPTEVLDRQPDCGCDACDTGSADLLETVDTAFVLALSGGVYAVREGDQVVRRTLDGWGSSGRFARGEQAAWLAEAAEGRRTAGVVRGEAWL
ncbi:Glyoxalase-like domain-containing protein [Nocardioides alpinus]|uniref:Glyoxalase-like domain-containing protein n=1 Tax=Nocardioides alpinus TaxID=748909 RepID=A0A1I0XXT8_9ACTN|nr:DUF6226 family protein [Nocardioides alpinus]SFB05744.1 Glyoxalase-like domain-containing protein [Nocardioides alpinus]